MEPRIFLQSALVLIGLLGPVGGIYRTTAAPLPLTGVNLAGGEFWGVGMRKGETHPHYGVNYSYPTKAEIDYFASRGMNVFRYPFLWETLQPELRTALDRADLERLKTSVRYATSRKLVVLLDPHNFARYYHTNIVGGPTVSVEDFADFWQRLAQEFRDDPYVWFGLVNEPHDMPTAQWFKAANACIAAIRFGGAKNLILVPGNSWTGANSWNRGGNESNAKWALSIKDPLDYWVLEVHQYVDADCSGTHRQIVSPSIGSERLQSFVQWCRGHRMRAILGEFGIPVVPDGEACLSQLLNSMERDRDVWLGWAWWAAGSRWGEYMFTLEPRNGEDRPQMKWLQPHLSGLQMPTFTISLVNGKGQCVAPAGSIQPIEANAASPEMVFKNWAGDTAWLQEPAAAKTTVTVPFKNIELRAVFEKATAPAAQRQGPFTTTSGSWRSTIYEQSSH